MTVVKMEKPTHKSTNIAAAGFAQTETDVPGEPIGRGKLRVQFVDGTIGEYDDVPRAVFNALLTDKSPGGFLHQHVKNHFHYRRLNLRYEVRLEIHEVEPAPDSSSLRAGDCDSPDPWSLGTFKNLKDALAYRNGMTVLSEVINEKLTADGITPMQVHIEDSALAETPAPATSAQS